MTKEIVSQLPVKWNLIHYSSGRKELNVWYKDFHTKTAVTIPENFKSDWMDIELKISIGRILSNVFKVDRKIKRITDCFPHDLREKPYRYFISKYFTNDIKVVEGVMEDFIEKRIGERDELSYCFSINGENFYDLGSIKFIEEIW
jgi:hypothetical protein